MMQKVPLYRLKSDTLLKSSYDVESLLIFAYI